MRVGHIAAIVGLALWLCAACFATALTLIVFFHVPMYSNLGVHGDDPTIAAALGPIFAAAGVDLVFQGHNHFYTRTYPILNGVPVGTAQEPFYTNPPSDGNAEIGYTLDRVSDVRVSIFNVAGRLVRVLDEQGALGPGPHAARWDGRDRSGRATPAGLYLARIQSEDRSVWVRILRVP